MSAQDFDRRAGTGADMSVTQLFKYLVGQVGLLFRQELALARSEMSKSARQLASAATLLVSGAILALAGLIVLLLAATFGIATALPLWASALIVGAVTLVIALILVLKGRHDLSARTLLPSRTTQTLREDVDLARGKAS